MLETTQMKCSDVRQLLPEYLNGSLDISTAQFMRWHFSQCNDCRTIVHSAVDTFRMNFREDRIRRVVPKNNQAA